MAGYKRTLKQEDVWELDETYSTKEIINFFQIEWQKEVEKVDRLVLTLDPLMIKVLCSELL